MNKTAWSGLIGAIQPRIWPMRFFDERHHSYQGFCYGPKGSSICRAGPTRKVPGRQGMSYTEEDWVDEDATLHRGPDDSTFGTAGM